MNHVHIVLNDAYPRRPLVAFLDIGEALEAANAIHWLAEEPKDRVMSIPLLSSSASPAMPQMEFRKDGTVYVACPPEGIDKFLVVLTKPPLAADEAPSCDEAATD